MKFIGNHKGFTVHVDPAAHPERKFQISYTDTLQPLGTAPTIEKAIDWIDQLADEIATLRDDFRRITEGRKTPRKAALDAMVEAAVATCGKIDILDESDDSTMSLVVAAGQKLGAAIEEFQAKDKLLRREWT